MSFGRRLRSLRKPSCTALKLIHDRAGQPMASLFLIEPCVLYSQNLPKLPRVLQQFDKIVSRDGFSSL